MKNEFIKAAFSTDPRAIEWAKTKFEVKPNDKTGLCNAINRLYEMAENGTRPQSEWLKDAQDLAERLGQSWDFRNEKAEDVVKKQTEHAAKRAAKEAAKEYEIVGNHDLRPLMPRAPQQVRHVVLGIPPTVIRPLETMVVSIQTFITFRMCRLVLADEIAAHVNVLDLKIGKNCQFGNCDPIPGSVFAARAFPLPLKCDTASPAHLITLHVSNVFGGNVTLNGALHGLGVE